MKFISGKKRKQLNGVGYDFHDLCDDDPDCPEFPKITDEDLKRAEQALIEYQKNPYKQSQYLRKKKVKKIKVKGYKYKK
jgi:hypothetical protein